MEGSNDPAIVQREPGLPQRQQETEDHERIEHVPDFMIPVSLVRTIRRRPSKRYRFALLPLLEAAALCLVLLFGGGAFMLWRLQQGPVSLDWARGYIEQALAADGDGDSIAVGTLTATWEPKRQAVALTAQRVDALNKQGERVGRTNTLIIELAPANLLHGKSAVSRFQADGGLFSLVLLSNGEMEGGIGAPDAVLKRKAKNDPERLATLIRSAQEAWRGEGPAGGLEYVSLTNARLILFDQRSGHTSTAQHADLALQRDGDVVKANFHAKLDSPGSRPGEIELTLSGAALGPLDSQLKLVAFNPHIVLPPDLVPILSSIDAPIQGEGTLRVQTPGQLAQANLNLSASAGKFRQDGEVRPFIGGRIAASYDPSADTLRLAQLTADAEGIAINATANLTAPMRVFAHDHKQPSTFALNAPLVRWTALPNKHWQITKTGELRDVRMTGNIYPGFDSVTLKSVEALVDEGRLSLRGSIARGDTASTRGHYSIKANGTLTGTVDVHALVALWPAQLAKGAREWIGASIHAGNIRNASIAVNLTAASQAAGNVPDEAISVKFGFEDGVVQPYAKSFILDSLAGSARLGGNTFKLAATGQSGVVKFTSASVDIGRLHPKGAPAIIRGSARGDLGGFAKMFATEMSAADVGKLGGDASANFFISRPMLSDVPWDDYVIDVKGAVNNARIDNVIGPLPLEGGRFDVVVDRDKLVARGAAKIGGQPSNLIWQETIRPTKGPTSQISIASIADATVLDSFGVPSRASMRGNFSAAISASGERLHFTKGAVSLDLAGMAITPEGLTWRKAKGTPGQFMLTFGRLNPQSPTAITINSFANGASLNGTATLNTGGLLASGDVNRFYIPGAFDVSAKFRRQPQYTALDIEGPLAEGRTILGVLFNGSSSRANTAVNPVPMHISASIEQMLAGNQPTLQKLSASTEIQNGIVARARIQAKTQEGKNLALAVMPDALLGERKLRLDADDLGAAARFIFKEGQVVGGRGVLEGRLYTDKGFEVADLKLRANDFELRGTPALGRILTLGSLRGMADVLNGDGIKFATLYAPMKVSGDSMQISEARAAGPAIGITVKGGLDFERNTMDLNGVLAPSYGMNSFLGAVPIVGGILVSRKGEGVFGMTYSMQGPFETARTTVNPLSVLTPGILRRIFEPGTPVAETTDTPRKTE